MMAAAGLLSQWLRLRGGGSARRPRPQWRRGGRSGPSRLDPAALVPDLRRAAAGTPRVASVACGAAGPDPHTAGSTPDDSWGAGRRGGGSGAIDAALAPCVCFHGGVSPGGLRCGSTSAAASGCGRRPSAAGSGAKRHPSVRGGLRRWPPGCISRLWWVCGVVVALLNPQRGTMVVRRPPTLWREVRCRGGTCLICDSVGGGHSTAAGPCDGDYVWRAFDCRFRMQVGASAGCLPDACNTQHNLFDFPQDPASEFSAPASSCWVLQEKFSRPSRSLQSLPAS
jgi:hypothetical protein